MMVNTGSESGVSSYSANITGKIIDLGEGATQYGHYYSTISNDTSSGSKTRLGTPSIKGEYTSELKDLTADTKYYVRAYISNGTHTVLGDEINFSTFTSTPPLAPTIGTATAGNGQATVTFTAPASNGGPPITGYKVTSDPGGITSNGSSSPITVTGLINGTAYTFIVTATNANGTGTASSASNSATPSTVPGAPTGVSATAGNGQATVSFTVPVSNGGSAITKYTATSNTGGFTGTSTGSPITVTGLTNGTAYTFTVTATNANGPGPASSASNSVTPGPVSTVPGAPTGVSAAKGNGQATVTFTAPVSTGGSPITEYTVSSNPVGFTKTGPASPITVTGLTNGIAYTFTVTATNANGTGPASSVSNSVTPSTVPGAPTGISATAGNTQATVTFTAPVSTGGSPITEYTVSSSPVGFTKTGPASPITVTGLANGTAYTFTVTATNANGTGTASPASNSVTPSTVPGAPSGVSATAGNTQATVTFTAPVSTGGSPITGYTVTSSPSGFTKTGSVSPITVTGLANGIAYTFTVTATNANGTGPASSASNSVIPSNSSLVYDADNNPYNTLTIGTQVWMVENLKTTKYNNGSAISLVADNTSWSSGNPAYCWYGDDIANKNVYGALYNWSAVNTGMLCPLGWHVPTDADWTTLITNLGGVTVAGGRMKETGNTHWMLPNTSATNTSGFSGLPGGYRYNDGTYFGIRYGGHWWSSVENDTNTAWDRALSYDYGSVDVLFDNKRYGFSVRCMKD